MVRQAIDRQDTPQSAGGAGTAAGRTAEAGRNRATSIALAAWTAGLLLAVAGLVGDLATTPDERLLQRLARLEQEPAIWLALLALAPVFWLLRLPRSRAVAALSRSVAVMLSPESRPERNPSAAARRAAHVLAFVAAATSLVVSMHVANTRTAGPDGVRFGDLPPAWHDEYSYLFMAQTFLAGRTSFPTHATAPQFFDQMHIVNDGGRFASRYFPGTGLWMAPFAAVGHPYWGHWLAGALVTYFLFWSGRELGGNGVGLLAGLLTALAPGMAIFSNMLLAHHPTLVGLSLFLWSFLRMLRTRGSLDALLAGCGLTFAMLCRPMTAAGFALPMGVWFAVWLLKRPVPAGGRTPSGARLALLGATAAPLAAALVGLFFYNRSITGDGWKTPYGLYTEIYTPRHVYGFDNVLRGEKRLRSKVRRSYDEWAENLTPRRAARNAGSRLTASWLWTIGVIPAAMSMLLFLGGPWRADRRWWLIPASIVSLHVAHVPYWYDGIMHWHYVFETGVLWALLASGVAGWLAASAARRARTGGLAWWLAALGVGLAMPWLWQDRSAASGAGASMTLVGRELHSIAWAKLKHARFTGQIEQTVPQRPAVVFIDPALEQTHIEHVLNGPRLDSDILRARLLTSHFEQPGVLQAFPGRSAYWVVEDGNLRDMLLGDAFPDYQFQHVAWLELFEQEPVDLWRVSAATPRRTSVSRSQHQ